MNTVRSSAIELYRRLGWSTLPVNGNTKKPLIPWKCFQNKMPSSFDIHEWSMRFANAGIAVITGPISKIVVLDMDGKEGVEEGKRLGLVKTPMVLTPRNGMHAYYNWPSQLPPFVSSTKKGSSKKLDVRGAGAYVVAPYTARSDGRKYEWIESPDKVPIADPPKWFLEMLLKLARAAEAEQKIAISNISKSKVSIELEKLISRLTLPVQKFVREGHDLEIFPSRSECDMAVIVALLAKGACDEDIEKIFSIFPIGGKYREPDEKGHYLERTLLAAYQRVRNVRIRYADPVKYENNDSPIPPGVRLQLALSVEGQSNFLRCGLTMPDEHRNDEGKWKNCLPRWNNFFNAVGVNSIPMTYDDLCNMSQSLRGKHLRIEVDFKNSRSNPVIGFHKIEEDK